jgi:hypothetical protein
MGVTKPVARSVVRPVARSVVAGVVAGSFTLDTDAAAYIASVEGASGDNQALEEGVKLAINAFVVGCKADGIWDAIKASCILAGARTLNGALRPLKGTAPTNVGGLFVSGDYNRKTGLVGDGSTKYLDSNRNNNADPQDSFHLSIYRTVVEASGVSINIGGGTGSDTGRSSISVAISQPLNNGLFFRCRTADGNETTGLPVGVGQQSTAGFIGASRTSSTNVNLRLPNGTGGSLTRTSQTPFNGNIGVFASASGSVASTYTASRLAFYSIGESLDLALLDARVTTLINAIDGAI